VLTLPEVDGLRKMYASMYPSPAFDEPLQQQLASSLQGSGQVVKVVMLNGDEHQVPYMGNMSIDQLKAQLYTTTRVVAGKQKLLFQGQELVLFTPLTPFTPLTSHTPLTPGTSGRLASTLAG
jgi:hypothetical protein